MICFDHPEAIAALEPLTNVKFVRGHDQCIARFEDGQFLGGVFFTDYNFGSVQIHVGSVAHKWIDRPMLWITFDYPFNKLKVNKLFGLVRESNKKALAFDTKLGFKVEARITDVFPAHEAMIVLAMYRDDCRYLKMPVPRITFESKRDG